MKNIKGIYCYINSRGYGRSIAEENFRLISALNEIRKYIRLNIIYSSSYYDDVDFIKQLYLVDNELDTLLEIIDKGLKKED